MDLPGETQAEIEAGALEYYRDGGLKPLAAKMHRRKNCEMIVTFADLTTAIDAALCYIGACLEDLDQESIADDLIEKINDDMFKSA